MLPSLRAEFNKFVELGIFLYNSRFLSSFLCSVKLCQCNDNSRLVKILLLLPFVWKLYPEAKMESQNVEFRAVIKFLTNLKEVANTKEIHRCIADVYGDQHFATGTKILKKSYAMEPTWLTPTLEISYPTISRKYNDHVFLDSKWIILIDNNQVPHLT